MSTVVTSKTAIAGTLDASVLARIIEEGYGPGAWHGPDLKAALDGVSAELAFWRPSPERHNIAEIVLHHAYYARQVRARLSGRDPEPFVLEGDDWFPLSDSSRLSWSAILACVDDEQRQLAEAVRDLGRRDRGPAPSADERVEAVLGITCHAVYHAGQVQLLKKLAERR
jgi:hypothetical protein